VLDQDQFILEKKETCTWFRSYGIVPHLAELVRAQNVKEIGVAYG